MQKEQTSLPFFSKSAVVAVSLSFALCSPPPASAQSDVEMDILRMIYKDQDLVTPTRSPKPISQVAENITVIDADEIEAINAHTLADVLMHVTGVQVDITGGPGSITNAYIQGSGKRHVRVVVDGVSLNNLSDNFPDIGAIPVQRIERVEIIKGPASSAWGSSLGGIINIITKSPDPDRRLGGIASASIGDRGTGDYRLDLSGTSSSVGYYLSAGGISGDGLTTNNPVDTGNIYGKIQFQPTEKIQIQFTQSYAKGARGDGQDKVNEIVARDRFEYAFSTLALNYRITNQVELNIAGRLLKQHNRLIQTTPGMEFLVYTDDTTYGSSANLSWIQGINNALIGFDYDNGAIESNGIEGEKKRQEKWAFFANDTISLGNFSVTPGLRYDNTSSNGDFVSPSLGITYNLFEKTIFRAYAARGFNIPPLGFTYLVGAANPDLKVEEVWSFSAGVETSAAEIIWFKATAFLNYINDVIEEGTFPAVNAGRQRRQGVEAEIRTIPFFNVSLMTGYSFIDATDRDSGQRIKGVPRQTWDLGIDYANSDILHGSLRGHYIWWNVEAANNARYKAMIWDLNLSKSFLERGETSLEAFFTAHNLFNGSQYMDGLFPNPRRWFEGGLRCKF
jgi:vitamin B12 transporter